jgi:hypothetical protein
VKAPPIPIKRASLTRKERAEMAERQGHKCACGCGRGGPFIAEHTIPVEMGNLNKPDCLLARPCAAAKTRKDRKDIAKAKHRAGETGQYKRRKARGYSLIRGKTKIESRGFDKSLRKHMDGSVSKR